MTQIGFIRLSYYPHSNFELEMLRLLTRPLYLSTTPSSSLRFKQGLALSSRKMATFNTPDFVRIIFNQLYALTKKLRYCCRTKSCMHLWQRSILKCRTSSTRKLGGSFPDSNLSRLRWISQFAVLYPHIF